MTEEMMNEPLGANLGRRKFLIGVAGLAGLTFTAGALAACGDSPSTVSSNSAASAAPTAANPNTTASATTIAATTAPASKTVTGTTAASGGTAPDGYTQIGPVSNFKAEADPVAFNLNNKKGFVYNKAGDFIVFSNICTHKGCEVPFNAEQKKFVCPCHGSQYEKTGDVIKGPAASRLPLFETKVVGETLFGKIA